MLANLFIPTTTTHLDRGSLSAWLERHFMTSDKFNDDDNALNIDGQTCKKNSVLEEEGEKSARLREGLEAGEGERDRDREEKGKDCGGKPSREPLVRTLRKKKSSFDLRDVFQHGEHSPTHELGDGPPTRAAENDESSKGGKGRSE
ncbi:hypothetical protein BV22DRAFT_547860 [Leucogyrophana mollusca]|uniref:Uncharacterized protein n=1 Tax=Leucogyrophana mollusca TaxID=85980 RepID=A0ACB8BDT1_9AGAM|nr:hypothetical protein BV22DRAFT_547860 [Leucogyrophana mollusca]